MKKANIILSVAVLGLTVVVVWLIATSPKQVKLGYIDIKTVFDDFNLKKELEKDLLKTKNQRDRLLDSLSNNLQVLAANLELKENPTQEEVFDFERRREHFITQKEQFQKENEELTAQYDQQILTQLNQYVKQYGEENGYNYIFGNEGNGLLMYAPEAENITEEVVEYLNNKYEGKTE